LPFYKQYFQNILIIPHLPTNLIMSSSATDTLAQTPAHSKPQTLTYYHAGPLFTIADLTANVYLSHLIDERTLVRSIEDPDKVYFKPVLPQDLEPRVCLLFYVYVGDFKFFVFHRFYWAVSCWELAGT
jgi:hypothetical protein